MLKIALIGSTGQLGYQLKNDLEKLKYNLKILPRPLKKNNFNFKKAIFQHKSDIVINTIAYTNVNKAEIEKREASRINSHFPKILSDICKENNSLLIHFSTDFVFNGNSTKSYKENDKTDPISVYGKTKLLGDKNIKKSNCNYLILRTSWVFSERRVNFFTKIKKLSTYKKHSINVVENEYGNPTSVRFLSFITILFIKKFQKKLYKSTIKKIYNVCCSSKTNRYLFAKKIVQFLNQKNKNRYISENKIYPINEKLNSIRPKNSSLNCSKLKKDLKIKIPSWQNELKKIINLV